MSTDIITSAASTVGGGFFGGILLGYAIKKVVKLIAVMCGLFIAGLAYLQYQQMASFDWNRIEGVISTTLGNVTAQILNGNDTAAGLFWHNQIFVFDEKREQKKWQKKNR